MIGYTDLTLCGYFKSTKITAQINLIGNIPHLELWLGSSSAGAVCVYSVMGNEMMSLIGWGDRVNDNLRIL